MDAYELLNQALSVIPGMSSPRYPGGGRVNTSVGQTGTPPPGQLAYKDGKPVFYVDPYYGYQSGESFKKATGSPGHRTFRSGSGICWRRRNN